MTIHLWWAVLGAGVAFVIGVYIGLRVGMEE